ncbi:MAG: hypothetical protein HY435_01205 [Candidatus Liptonbacteria bacterium]|nr:hypothetical protein [Candidatus Liptonbacteria bacterium]
MKDNINSAFFALTDEDRLELYALMARTRALEESLIMNRRTISGPLLVAMGQEAVAAGSFLALHKAGILEESIKAPDHRIMFGATVAIDMLLQKGPSLTRDLFRNFFARATGGNLGRDGNQHWGAIDRRLMPFMCSDMSVNAMVAIGYAEELRRREWPGLLARKRPVGIVFFGDGAAQQGIVHEGMNWVAASNFAHSPEEIARLQKKWIDKITHETRVVRGAPMIFVINENSRACYTSPADEHGASELSKRACGYGNMVGVDVDGTDPEAVFRETWAAIIRAQNLQSTLIVAHSYRLSGHNADQTVYKEGALERREFFEVERIFGCADLGEFRAAVEKDPVHGLWKSTILERKIATREKLDGVLLYERRGMDALLQETLTELKITVMDDEKDRSIFPAFPRELFPDKTRPTKRMGYNKAFAWIVETLIREDERVVYFGEDVANAEGGVLALTKGVYGEFGPVRIFNTPISEEAIVATAAGRALAGGKPKCEFQFGGFWWDGARIFAHVIAPNWYSKKLKFGVTAVFPCGIVHKGSSGHFHEDWPERFLVPMRGIVVVAPATAYEVVGFMRTAHEYEGPVAVLLQISAASLSDFYAEVPEEPYGIPFGKANIVREGKDVTVITYGAACVAAAKNEAEKLSEEGISVEVIDLRTVWPYDEELILSSVAKTGRAVLMHEDYYRFGFGQMLLGDLNGHKFLEHVKTRDIKVLGASTPFIPTDPDLVWDRLPYERGREEGGSTRHRSRKLATAVRDLMKFS